MSTENVHIQSQIPAIIEELARKLVGQRETLELFVAACLARGHVLLEDVPGTGKTTLASSMAQVLGLSFHRVQGTPDLLPADIVGSTIFDPDARQFSFHPGPIFTNILLMDEINRATPRTQSALLEAMAEHQVSVDGESRTLPNPFFVLATANPIESQGVFPLPEAQLDRFLVQLQLGYVTADEEMEMVRRVVLQETAPLKPIWSAAQIQQAQTEVQRVHVSDVILRYIVDLCRATRQHDQVLLGASPRAIVALTQYAQALAYVAGRAFVRPDDVKRGFVPVLAHRLQLNIDWMGQAGAKQVLQDVLQTVPVPHERAEA